jgi:hypothetical protein
MKIFVSMTYILVEIWTDAAAEYEYIGLPQGACNYKPQREAVET